MLIDSVDDLIIRYNRISPKLKEHIINSNHSYFNSYDSIIQFSKKLNFVNVNDVVILSHIVYGWMPTILNLNMKHCNKLLPFLIDCKKLISVDDIQGENGFKILKETINNSIVGGSKLLHFVNPRCFPIWDSRIANELYGFTHGYQINNIRNFIIYFYELNSFIKKNNNEILLLTDKVSNLFSTPLSQLRAVELILFYSDKY